MSGAWESAARCEWVEEPCANSANHLVHITFPDEPSEIWRVCRAHDRELKKRAVARRVPRTADPDPPADVIVHCGQCDEVLDEPVSCEPGSRQPCPHCGSTVRRMAITLTERVTVHESFGVKQKRAGKGGWLKEMKAGDDYTRDLQAWGEREQEYDHEHQHYRELIKLYDGTTIESSAPLSGHRDK